MDDADWDLQAVVRGCCSAVSSAATTATTTTVPSFPLEGYNQQKSTLYGDDNNIGVLTFFPDLFQPRNDINSIEHFMNDVFYPQKQKQPPPPPPTPPQSFQISPFSFLGGFQDPTYNQQQQQKRQFQIKQESLGISRCTTSHAQSTTKIKKRKNQTKRVCQVPLEGPSPDFWSWRKYGQKPIKGSPYPRGYYKCSTLKGCSARKQVERNRSDPGMLIITYTGEHTHPVPSQLNSLSGSTRNKTTTVDDIINKPTPSPPISPADTIPPVPENEPERFFTDDEDNTFDGLDELVGPSTGDVFSGHMPVDPATGFHWLSNNLVVKTTTTAAGGS